MNTGAKRKRFYVTMTWDNWPEGGSFGTVVMAKNVKDAEKLCRQEMAITRADGESDPATIQENYGHEWHVVDCFALDRFVEFHQPKAA